jgi:hypothetical protein
MGLLDDAIREHLELKRRRGADPGLVAREEKDAFGPIPSREADTGDDRDGIHDELDPDEISQGSHDPSGDHEQAPGEGFSSVGQETAELDMRSVLDDGPAEGDAPAAGPVAVGPVSAGTSTEGSGTGADPTEESLEWEVPREGLPKEMAEQQSPAGQVGHTGDRPPPGGPEATSQADGPVEDVLEETPDFLRETPEQDRLWFEQRPPRDFDFDK